MPHDLRKYLFDILDRCTALRSSIAGRTFDDYESDRMLRRAVERELEIVGEALRQALRLDPSLESRISKTRRVIAFRNWLAHAYSEIDDEIIWDILQRNLPLTGGTRTPRRHSEAQSVACGLVSTHEANLLRLARRPLQPQPSVGTRSRGADPPALDRAVASEVELTLA